MDLSIVIVNWNSAELLRNCLASVDKWLNDLSYEAVVVDNCSSKEDMSLLKQVEKEFPWARFIYNSTNVGFAKANNQAFKVCEGQYILLLNPDTCFLKKGLANLITLCSKPNTGIVSCKLLNSDKSVQLSCFYFPRLGKIFTTSLLLHKLMPLKTRHHFVYSAVDHEEQQKPDWVLGAFMLLPKHVLDQVHGFDESIFMYGEDMDLCYRIRRLGLDIVYTPDFAIVHYGGCSGRKAWSDAKKEVLVYQAILSFCAKQMGPGWTMIARFFYALGALLRLSLYTLGMFRPGKFRAALNEMKTQWWILLTQFRRCGN